MNEITLSGLSIKGEEFVLELLEVEDVMRFLGPRRALDIVEAQEWFLKELEGP